MSYVEQDNNSNWADTKQFCMCQSNYFRKIKWKNVKKTAIINKWKYIRYRKGHITFIWAKIFNQCMNMVQQCIEMLTLS